MFNIEDSSTCELILDKGRIDHARSIVSRLGQRKFGPPPTEVKATIKAIEDVDRLDRMVEFVNNVSSWQELLAIA